MQIDNDTLTQVACDVFTSMLGIPIEPAAQEPADAAEPLVASYIGVSGDWTSALEIVTTERVARQIASGMYEAAADNLPENDVFDALGEIANMIGGNVKGIIGGECSLSLPRVDRRREWSFTDTQGAPCTDLHFHCLNGIVAMRLTEKGFCGTAATS
ncbi:MAG: chemotaxis protein CheX [Pirellulaceae bacterium]|nr:chemotaxis protein CheX [Planctomycetales bacterium]